jgi:hypothetical protein
MYKLTYWFYRIFLPKRIRTGASISNGEDYSCTAKGFIDRRGKYYIVEIKFY